MKRSIKSKINKVASKVITYVVIGSLIVFGLGAFSTLLRGCYKASVHINK